MPILICYDDSHSARRALEVVKTTLGHEPAVLLHVWNPPDAVLADSFSSGGADVESGPTQVKLERMAVDRAAEVVESGRRLATGLGLEVTVREVPSHSSVWRTILDVAGELDADLIVVGTHGTTAVQELALGSVSGGLVHHSERPVLVVPAGPRAG